MKQIVYCLTGRGLYSELSNLALAYCYARLNGYRLVVNTRRWNARLKHGLTDYFQPFFPESQSLWTAQDKIFTLERRWVGKVYYNPQ